MSIKQNKLDKFFKSKDAKKVKDQPSGQNLDDKEDKELGAEFGLDVQFTAKTVKLTKTGVIEEEDTNAAPAEYVAPAKTWRPAEEVAQQQKEELEKLEAEKALAEKQKSSQAYRPGQGRPRQEEKLVPIDDDFPTLGEAVKFKSAEEYQKSKEEKQSEPKFKARTTPANAWSSQSSNIFNK
eukprot:NODE_8271_length_694_cov_25.901926_g7649_i0.p1 GENE.NODE_8271_length_694_cov_25.901926_g7649_i0~~NODE_8271_length_694_cov_25.901926_g7649_i0.p1  ORF type:complete len:181 (-),score=49.00 NODE_8271_length_694_cov_25.901926_g7649_i0:103-645(-)